MLTCRSSKIPRPPRIEFPGAWYHLYNRGIARQAIFRDDQDRHLFLSLLAAITEKLNVQCHGYCLMDNHYHLIFRTPQANLSDAMKQLISAYTRMTNKRHGRDGPLFKGRYRSEIIEDDDYLLSLSRYLHLNPVEAEIVDDPRKYKWSSYNSYINSAKAPDWLETEFILAMMTGQKPRQRYRHFVSGRSATTIVEGSAPSDTFEHDTSSRKTGSSQSVNEVLATASSLFGVTRRELVEPTGSRPDARNERIAVLLFLAASREAHFEQLADHFGYANSKSLSAALSRWRGKMKTDKSLDSAVTTLAVHLQH